MITFDPTINAGHIIEAVLIVVGGLTAMITLRNEVANVKSDVSGMQIEVKKIAEVMVTLGRQDERLKAMDNRIERLTEVAVRPVIPH